MVRVGVRETAESLQAAAERADEPSTAARWLARSFLEYRFLGDRAAQARVAVRMAGLGRDGLAPEGHFLASAVDGLVTSYADDGLGTLRLMAATALFERAELVTDPLCAELYGEVTLVTGECVAAREVLDAVVAGGQGSEADRHRLNTLLARIELVLARPVPAASALHTASRLTAFVDAERVGAVDGQLESLVDAPSGHGLTGEELEVAAALAHSPSVAAAAAELAWSIRDVEFYRASARAKLERPGRHRGQRRAG